jgi:hypothetical protein
MKTPILILIFVAALVAQDFSQDTLFVGAGKTIAGKVVEIGADVVKYKKPDHTDGPLYDIARSEVTSVHYADGSRDDFSAEPSAQTQSFVMVHVANQDDQLVPMNQTVDTRILKGNNEKIGQAGQVLGAALVIGAEIATISYMNKNANNMNNGNRSSYKTGNQYHANNSCSSNSRSSRSQGTSNNADVVLPLIIGVVGILSHIK